ncbi:hypothetical protein KUF83_10685, partial [Streptomyces sp. BV286]|uniref:type IIL restriction-modification enzyme MmeI n=1 Tax=Streptomyces sp. BV286 TaxID=2849672 RepID=UPI001ECBCBC6|nr:hypothetical protein [Streptomyces sp. BV286]
HDWSEDRARSYPEVFSIIERDVKPERLKNNRKSYRDYWWQYAEKRPAMISAVKGLDRVLVVARVSKTGLPVFVPTGQVVSEQTVVFATDQLADLALLSSGIHYSWAIARASSLKGDLRYTPSDVYETLPRPTATTAMEDAGQTLDDMRREIMTERKLGLTSLYKIVHDPTESSSDIQALRSSHRQVDEAIVHAYGWSDLEPNHGFHETRQGTRFLINPTLGREIMDRLLELNHVQHGREAALRSPRVGGRVRAAQSIEVTGDGLLF